MKHNTQRDQADKEVERIKSVLKNTGLDYYMEESPYCLSIHHHWQWHHFLEEEYLYILMSHLTQSVGEFWKVLYTL